MKKAPDNAIIAGFYLNDGQWDHFKRFFKRKPKGKFDLSSAGHGPKRGHAVVIVGIGTDKRGRDYFKIKNSWGTRFGDAGHFRVYCDGLPFSEFWMLR